MLYERRTALKHALEDISLGLGWISYQSECCCSSSSASVTELGYSKGTHGGQADAFIFRVYALQFYLCCCPV